MTDHTDDFWDAAESLVAGHPDDPHSCFFCGAVETPERWAYMGEGHWSCDRQPCLDQQAEYAENRASDFRPLSAKVSRQ